MGDWREDILRESAQISKLAKNPASLLRLGKSRRTPCKGDCGRRIWGDYCRKCSRSLARAARKGRRK